MRRIERAEVEAALAAREQCGHHVDPRLIDEIRRDGDMFMLRLEDEASFLSLIWQESNPARLLTPPGAPRTLRDIAERMIREGHTFESLSKGHGRPRTDHHPEWFEPCLRIDQGFDFQEIGWFAVVAATDGERKQSPRGSLYLYDGMHKSLVLAKRLLRGETAFQPVDALWLVPRRG